MRKHYGFTLAETLVTLVVIGIVFSYTVPALVTNYKNRDLCAAYQKAINNLNNAYVAYYNSPPSDKESGNKKKYDLLQYGSNGETLDEDGNAETDSNPVVKFAWVADGNRYQIGTAGQLDSVYRMIGKIFIKHMDIKNIKGVSDSKIIYYAVGTDKDLYDYTSMAHCTQETTPIEYFYTGDGMRYCISYNKITNNSKFGEDTYGVIWVDTNGEKGPNETFRNVANSTTKPLYVGETLPITILKDRFVPGHPTNDKFNTSAQNLFFNRV